MASEVRKGQRPASLVPSEEGDEPSGWRELEYELAEDGISKAEISKHKTAIRVFLRGLLGDHPVESMSMEDVVSIVESNEGGGYPQPGQITKDSRVSTFDSVDSAQYETAVEELSEEDTYVPTSSAPRIAFAQHLPSRSKAEFNPGIDKRLQSLPKRRSSSSSIFRYRHSIDASTVDPSAIETRTQPTEQPVPSQNGQLVLIIDATHSSISKLAHAYLRSLVKAHPIVKEHIDTVRSTAWQEHNSGDLDSLSVDYLIREVLSGRKIGVPKWERTFRFAPFQLRDVIEFDHIIYFDSPSFRQVLRTHIDTIASLKEKYGAPEKPLARLTQYDMVPPIQVPEAMRYL